VPRYAAIDIGSNSVRMLAAEVAPGSAVRVLASGREVTRLGESVFRTGSISEEAMKLTCEVLARMAAQYQALDVAGVRAVATSSARDALNQAEFLERASQAIGGPVEAISGREEARLIHLGVLSRWPQPGRHVLIVDIGGGSAELIGAEDGRILEAVSRPLGAVRLRELFLADDPPSPRELHQIREFIQEKLADAFRRFGARRWDRAIATSATAAAVACAIGGVPRTKRDRVDRLRSTTAQVRKLYNRLSALDLAGRRRIAGIGPRRAEIIVPGVAVLLEILERLRLPSVYYSAAGVRDGIVADLAARGVGRELARLSRDQRREAERLSLRYGSSLKHARQVAALGHVLFNSLLPLHQLPPAFGKLLEAAAYLHDIGHYVSDLSHHKHSYYLVANSDMSGFTNRERELIANLCRYHRKALPASTHLNTRSLNAEERRALQRLIPLLRVADSLDRSHDQRVKSLECQVLDGQVILQLASSSDIDLEGWAAERAGEVFREVYGVPVAIRASKGNL
jgi:exopolyphosphatase / guanosine-5'-triphosphate,3'-diphosphate pyrophosphatase